MPSPYSAPTAYNLNPDQQAARDQMLYDPDRPDWSFTNAMMDTGRNPHVANPYTQQMRRLGGGITAGYMANMAMNGLGGRNNIGTSQAPHYGDFMRKAIDSGGVVGHVQQQQSQLPQLIQKVRQYRTGLADGSVNAGNLDPYMAQMSDLLAGNEGRGTVDFLNAVQAPLMNRSMASAYSNALNANYQNAIRKLSLEGPTGPNDIWTYLLGV